MNMVRVEIQLSNLFLYVVFDGHLSRWHDVTEVLSALTIKM